MGIYKPLDERRNFLNTFSNFTKSEIESGDIYFLACKIVDFLVEGEDSRDYWKKNLESFFGQYNYITKVIRKPKYLEIYTITSGYLGGEQRSSYRLKEANGRLEIILNPSFMNYNYREEMLKKMEKKIR